MQEKNAKVLNMSLRDYYQLLGSVQSDFKKKVLEALEISDKTFYNRLTSDSWTALERKKILEIIDQNKSVRL